MQKKTPAAWAGKIETEYVDVLPLIDKEKSDGSPGWTTYEASLIEAPEIEFICGGINTKTPAAVGIWRQGNLMHFGFETSPAKMNDTGDALLINSIHYIARFTEDRPTLYTVSPFVGNSTRSRNSIFRWLDNENYPVRFFESVIDPTALAEADTQDKVGYRSWFKQVRDYLHPNEKGLLTVDHTLKSLGFQYDKLSFFENAINALSVPETQDAAREVLTRYAPVGPDSNVADDMEWRSWFNQNKPYLFYSEYGGYHWYIDPLARKRGIPTAELRGPDRADLEGTMQEEE